MKEKCEHADWIEEISDSIERTVNKFSISITWTIDDVLSLDPSLTDCECKKILQKCLDEHDANIGVNWDVLQCHIDRINYEKEKKNESYVERGVERPI